MPQQKKFDDSDAIPFDDSDAVAVDEFDASDAQPLDSNNNLLSSASEFAGGAKDVGLGFLKALSPIQIGEPGDDPITSRLGFSIKLAPQAMAEGMVNAGRGAINDFGNSDYTRSVAGLADIIGLPATGTLDLAREGNYSRAAGMGIAGLGLAYGGAKAGKGKAAAKTAEKPKLTIKPEAIDPNTTKTYPPMRVANPAAETELARFLRIQENPENIMYPREEPGGFGQYVKADESIQAQVMNDNFQKNKKFEDFIRPSTKAEVPASPYSERMEFDPFTSDPNQSYPLNVVPSKLQPRAVQSQYEALVPERLKVPPHIAEQELPSNPTIELAPRPNNLGEIKATTGTAVEGGTVKYNPKDPYGPKLPFEDRVDAYVAKNIPEAVPQIKAITAVGRNTLQKLADETLISGEQQLERMGPVGREIHNVLAHTDHTKRELFNRYADPFIKATEKLSKEEMANLADAVEGLAEPMSDKVFFAVQQTRAITDALGAEAVNAGVRVKDWKGKIRNFEPIGNYWPHKPTTPPNRQGFIDDLLNSNPEMTRDQAMKLSQRFAKESEFFASPQHGRWPGKFNYSYRKDMNAMIDHIADMADIVSRAKHLGPGDIAKKVDSRINQLIEASPDPVRAHELVRSHVRGGMDKNSEFYQAVKKVNNFVTRTQVFSKLGLFPISAYNNQLLTAMKGNISQTVKAFGEATFGSKELQDLAKEYGTVSVGRVPLDILSEANTQPVRFTGSLVNWAENMQRTIATGAGRGTSRILFDNAKKGNQRSARRLSDLLLEDVTEVLKQNELTPEQLKFATQRFVEITQQLGSNRKIPPLWANEPLIQIPLIFKKFAFQGTKAIKDTIMENPVRNIPMLLVGSQLLGELTGDLKAIVTGAVRGGVDVDTDVLTAIAHQLGHRHKYAGKILHLDADESDFNWLVNRLTANLMQSWALGIPGDALQAAIGGKDAIKTFMLGPAIEQAASVTGAAVTGNATQLGREALRTVPVIGPGLQQGLLPTKNQEIQ